MAETSRLAKLPGYDTAPDVYETPELNDDISTTRQTSPNSPSASDTPASSDSEDSDDENGHGLSRRHISTSAARERFTRSGKGLEVRAGDFGDRLGVRKGYRLRRREGAEEDESLEQRIARLRREVEECRVLAREAGESGDDGDDGAGVLEETGGLKKVLDGLEGGRVARQVRQAEMAAHETQEDGRHDSEDLDEGTAARVANFDSRLAVLERSLGLSAIDATSLEAVSNPILPSLTLLDQQLNALMTASSITNLEVASARLVKLREEAEQTQFTALEPSQNGTSTGGTSTPTSPQMTTLGLAPPDLQKLQELFTLLPNLQSLSPSVPALLDRLRSLRTLHAGAASASTELEDLEKSQAEFESEMKEWREGLNRVEGAMKDMDEANGRNGKVVQGWVKELEGKMKALGNGR